MKKMIAVALLFAVIFCFAACSKNKGKGEIYVPPQTEVVTFEDGLTAVFEVVTEENGEVATDAEGETKYIPYIPPVTEEGGYLVTDAQGSTILDLPTTTNKNSANGNINIDNEIADLDEPTGGSNSAQKPEGTAGSAQKPEGTTGSAQQNSTTKPQSGTNPLRPSSSTTASGKPNGTTAPPAVTPSTQPATEATTKELDGTLTSAKAQKLVDIMKGIENPFDDDLAKADFHAAEKSLDVYIANVEAAVKEIKSDKALYQFVGNEQLDLWINNMYEVKDRYAIFTTMVEQEKNPLYQKAYTDFQDSYRDSLETYYFILFAAEDRI